MKPLIAYCGCSYAALTCVWWPMCPLFLFWGHHWRNPRRVRERCSGGWHQVQFWVVPSRGRLWVSKQKWRGSWTFKNVFEALFPRLWKREGYCFPKNSLHGTVNFIGFWATLKIATILSLGPASSNPSSIEFPFPKSKMGRRLMDGWGDEVIGGDVEVV